MRDPTNSEKLAKKQADAKKAVEEGFEKVRQDSKDYKPETDESFVIVLENGKLIRRSASWWNQLTVHQKMKMRVQRTHDTGNLFQLSEIGKRGPGRRTRVFSSLS